MEKNKSFLGCAMLFLAAFFWGTTTVVQSMAAAADLPSFTYLAARSFVGAIALWAVVLLRQVLGRRSSKGASVLPQSPSERKTALKGGILCGAVLTGAAYLHQQGIVFGASAGEVGFLTSLYMLFVPLFSFLLYRRKVSANVLFGAVFMLVGLYFLCIMDTDRSSLNFGHLFEIGCAVVFAFHILAVERYRTIDGMLLSSIQFTVCGLISTVCALIFEQPSFSALLENWFPICFAGICSSAIGFTLQIYGQKYAPATIATILMSMESVIALLAEWLCNVTGLFVGKNPVEMTAFKVIGCILAFAGILMSQLKFFSRKEK